MKDELFNELLTSVEEAIAIAEGDAPLERVTTYKGRVLVEVRQGTEVIWSLKGAAEALEQKLPVASIPLVNPSPKFIRETLCQTQEGFAQLLGVSVETVRGWEQGKRQPRGAARTLLNLAAHHPMTVLSAADPAGELETC